MNIENLDEIFLNTARIVEKRRKVTTVTGLEEELQKELHHHKRWAKEIVTKKER